MGFSFQNITSVKIYFNYGQHVKGQSFWKKLWSNNLGQVLLKNAKEMGIRQATIYAVKAGYLHSDSISINNAEFIMDKQPVCLELFDLPEKLESFLEKNKTFLADTDTILLNNNCYQLNKDFNGERNRKEIPNQYT